jgi:hypothetical protein
MRKHALERDLQKAVVKYLEGREKAVGDLTFLHIPNEGKRHPVSGYALKKQGMRPGAPDLIVWLKGKRVVQIELKSMTGKISATQQAFCQTLEALGHEYWVVKQPDTSSAVKKVEAIIDG